MADCFHLPDDVIYMILLRLPAKTLLRFRCLSKEWNKTIIKNRAFAKEHMLMQSGNNTSTSNVLFMCTSAGYSYRCVIESNFDREVRRVMNVKVDLPFKKYIDETTSKNTHHWCGLSSSCHGLLCLIYHCNDRAILFVWNPLTNHYKEITWPEEHVTEQDAKGAFVGFGYDHILNDYKIVVSVYVENLQLIQVHVMTLSTNVWRSVDAAPWQHLFKDECLDSKPLFDWRIFCWLGVDKRNNCHVLMKFNLVEEKLTVIYIRGRDINYPGLASKLGQYKGLPCYYIYQTGSIPIMDRYGMLSVYAPGPKIAAGQKRRWQKFINEHDVPAPTIGTTLAEPIGFVTDGDMLLMSVDNGRGLAAYFRNKCELLELNLSELIEQNVQDVCYLAMESLINPC
ncbi:hypothetical protein QQ045_021849 [Rhodiola kirilowii]